MISNISYEYDKYYDIFVHEKDQFWPRRDMLSFGQSDPIHVAPNREIEVIFTTKKIINLNKDDRVCNEDPNYSFTICLKEFVEREADCKMDFFSFDIDNNEHCSTDGFLKYFNLLIKLKQAPISDVVRKTKCYPKCKIVQYLIETNYKHASWTNNWTAQVYY